MVLTYFEIGIMLVEEEQGGKERAEYGKELLKGLSKVLNKEFGKGFSVTNLKQMRNFYLIYGKGQTLSDVSQRKPSTLLTKSESEKTQTMAAELGNTKDQDIQDPTMLQQLNLVKNKNHEKQHYTYRHSRF